MYQTALFLKLFFFPNLHIRDNSVVVITCFQESTGCYLYSYCIKKNGDKRINTTVPII